VGQGDAILIQKGNQRILIDGGPDPEKICFELGKRFPFWDKSLDLVVLTHLHDDHLIGLVEVLKRYKVGQILESPKLNDEPIYNSPAYEEWLNLIAEKGIKRTLAQAGQQIDLGDGIKLEVLHPQTELLQGTDSDIDNNGIVLRLAWNEVSFLLTADIHEEAEREILHQGVKLRSTILKVAHHGSGTSTCPQFLAAVDPEIVVISVGKDNPFGHPAQETMCRLEGRLGEDKIYLTSEKGTITFTTDGKKLWVET
jgi:competence protein ComEC